MRTLTYREAVREALDEELARDKNVFLIGEEVAEYDGPYKVSKGLLEKYGPKRIIDTPISESGFAGLGIGAAMYGLRPIIEFMTWSFSFVAFDQIVNNAAQIRYMSGGQVQIPIVFRGPANGGTGNGATHSHTPENLYANFPGLYVVCPANGYDAKGLLKTAIRDNNPVCVMENLAIYDQKCEIPEEDYTIPLGKADIKRSGDDISLIGHGKAILTALEAAEKLKQEKGIEAEVVDLRSIRPLDETTILSSVSKTHRVVLVEENKPYCGVGSHICSIIQEKAFDELDAPIQRVSALDVPQPYSPDLENKVLPDANRIYDACLKIL